MFPHRRVRRPPRLGLLVTLVVLTLSACNGGEKQQQSKPQLLPEDQQELRPGVYRSEEFEPSLSFRVGAGWTTSPPEVFDALLLTREQTVVLGFLNVLEVYEPSRSGIPTVARTPDDLVGWFRQHPYLRTSEPQPVTVGGVKGERFEVVVEEVPQNYSGPCAGELGECVDIFESSAPPGWIALLKGNKQRLIVLEEVKGQTVTMGFSIPATEFDEHAPEPQKVLDSVTWISS